MREAGWMFGLLCLLAAAVIVFWNQKKTKKIIKNIGYMLDAAVNGTYTETMFNESELLLEEEPSDSARANVEAIYHQSGKLRFLIDSLVKLSRLENGIIKLSTRLTSLQPVLERIVEQYAVRVSEKGLSLHLSETDVAAVFDPKWTAEALANIVDNAIKYTEHGAITISAQKYELFARIDIRDTGIGIPESEQAKIFLWRK